MDWHLLNEEDGATLFPLYSFALISAHRYPEMFHAGYPGVFDIQEGHLKYVGGPGVLQAIAAIYRKMKDGKTARKIRNNTLGACEKLDRFSGRLQKGAPSAMTDDQISDAFRRHQEIYDHMNAWGVSYAVVELGGGLITHDLCAMLEKKRLELKLPDAVGEMASVLSTPTADSKATEEEKKALTIAAGQAAGKDVSAAIRTHVEKYAWVYYGYTGPAMQDHNLRERLDRMAPVAADELERMEKRQHDLAKKKKRYEKQLGFSATERELVRLARDAVALKARRKESMFYSFYALEPYQKQVAKRAGLTLKEVQFAMAEEIPAILAGTPFREILQQRLRHVIFYADGKTRRTMVGAEAEKFAQRYQAVPAEQTDTFRGQCACPGSSKGTVRIVNTPEQMRKMRHGDILVSIATTPDIVPSMKMASAVVTNIGGLTCHAAVVSRELGVPCVIGTRHATTWLKDGDLVEVDATQGIVRKLGKSKRKK